MPRNTSIPTKNICRPLETSETWFRGIKRPLMPPTLHSAGRSLIRPLFLQVKWQEPKTVHHGDPARSSIEHRTCDRTPVKGQRYRIHTVMVRSQKDRIAQGRRRPLDVTCLRYKESAHLGPTYKSGDEASRSRGCGANRCGTTDPLMSHRVQKARLSAQRQSLRQGHVVHGISSIWFLVKSQECA